MASVFKSWKQKYDTGTYNRMVREYKDKLRLAAKKNTKFGGPVLVNVICTKCNKAYKGISNQLICNNCKKNGYSEICRHCHNEFITLSGSKCCDQCKKTQPWKRNPRSKEVKNKISKNRKKWANSREGKKFYEKLGKFNSNNLKRFYSTPKGKEKAKATGKKVSRILKEKIANGEYTPIITNSRTHWDAKIILSDTTIKKFRSSWEAAFWNSNKHLEYETLRIPWVDENGESHTYIADFFDRETDTVYEIKPRSSWCVQESKVQQAIKWCKEHNLKFIWINENNILDYIDENDFDIPENKKQLDKVLYGIKKN